MPSLRIMYIMLNYGYPKLHRAAHDYSTAYPIARALSMTCESLVTMVTSWGGSPSNSAVAKGTLT